MLLEVAERDVTDKAEAKTDVRGGISSLHCCAMSLNTFVKSELHAEEGDHLYRRRIANEIVSDKRQASTGKETRARVGPTLCFTSLFCCVEAHVG